MDPEAVHAYLKIMSDRIYDIVIVGAGPTGAALALGLARLELYVAVIDTRDPKHRRGRGE